jgi:hypothetical protein
MFNPILFYEYGKKNAENLGDLRSGLVSYYKIDEVIGSTVLVDSHGGQNLSVTNLNIDQVGKIGRSAYSIASNSSAISSTCTPITGNFSINVWCFMTANGTPNDGVVDIGSYGDNTGFGIWVNTANSITCRINQNFNYYDTVSQLTLNAWTMATVSYDGANIKIYINSVLKKTIPLVVAPNSSAKRRLFNRADTNSNRYIGGLDECLIYNRALLSAEISQLYNSGSGMAL